MADTIGHCGSPMQSLAPDPDPSCRVIITDSDMATTTTNSTVVISKPICFIADQTPTPTRFIRNCEEVGLFQDLQNVNPFDEQFRRATEAVTSGASSSSAPRQGVDVPNGHLHHVDDALHTPHVFPPLTAEPLRPLLLQRSCSVDEAGLLRPSFLVPSLSISDGTAFSIPQLPSSAPPTEENTVRSVPVVSFAAADAQMNKTTSSIKRSNRKRSDPGPASVNRHASNKRLFTSRIRNLLPSNPPISAAPVLAPTIAKKTESGVQLLLRLPDGKLLQIPALPLAPETSVINSATKHGMDTVITRTSDVTTIQNSKGVDARQKLKEALSRGSTRKEPQNVIFNSPVSTIASAVPEPNNNSNSASSHTSARADSESDGSQTSRYDSDPNQTVSSRKTHGKKLRRGSEDDTPEDKRRKFLERNREAAYRSRQKRKDWIHTLETVAGELSATNKRLVTEVANLKTEVAQLKVLLLAHKDCPVTKAIQQGLITVNPVSLEASEVETSPVPLRSLPTTRVNTDPQPPPDRQIIILNAGSSSTNGNPVPPPVIIFKPFLPANKETTLHLPGTQSGIVRSAGSDVSKELDGSPGSLPIEVDLEASDNVSFTGVPVSSLRTVIISPRTK